jgi:3-keto-5-aminohexanoate cleavage enzyme
MPVMIMVAPTGAFARKSDNPATPLTPAEIAAEVISCAASGACIAHLHARDPDGRPTQAVAVYREIIERIREKSDIVLQISLGSPGFTIDEALEPITLRPEMVSLPLSAFLRDDLPAQAQVRQMAEVIRDHGISPEMSVYNEDMMGGALGLIASAAVLAPSSFGFVLRNPQSMADGARKLMKLVEQVPPNAHWWIAKGDAHALGLRALAIEMGGHPRVGFEDSVLDFGGNGLAKSNTHLVERVAGLCASLGRSLATPAQARAAVRGCMVI